MNFLLFKITLAFPISKISSFSYIIGVAGRDVRMNTMPYILAASSVARSVATASEG